MVTQVMKQVMHQVPMHCTCINTEAMTTAHVQVLKLCISSCKATQMSTVASQSISDLPLEITYVSLVLYTLEPQSKRHFGTNTKSKYFSFTERLSFIRRLYLLLFM